MQNLLQTEFLPPSPTQIMLLCFRSRESLDPGQRDVHWLRIGLLVDQPQSENTYSKHPVFKLII